MFIGILYIAINLLHMILHCQTPSLLSVSCALVVVAHYLWVSLLAWRSVCLQLHQYRKKKMEITTALTAPKAGHSQNILIQCGESLWIKGGVFPFSNPLVVMNSSLWAPRDPGGCSLWFTLRALLQVNRGNGQLRSSTATQCPADCLTTLFITTTIRVLWASV